VKAELGHWRPAFELYHESSHLGDEYRDDFKCPRLDWTANWHRLARYLAVPSPSPAE